MPNCQPCIGCLTCSVNQTNCLSCTNGQYLLFGGNTCVTNCGDGYYAESSNMTCQPCDASCTKCTGPLSTQCLACLGPTYFFAVPSVCTTSCPAGLYKGANQICAPCLGCATCAQTNGSYCLTCNNDTYMLNNQCVLAQNCAPGTYPNKTIWSCEPCNTYCTTCLDSTLTSCGGCQNGYCFVLPLTTCVPPANCPPLYYANVGTAQCLLCGGANNCSTCTDVATCTSCNTGYFLDTTLSVCSQVCPPGYYGAVSNNTCLSCHTNCLLCFGNSPYIFTSDSRFSIYNYASGSQNKPLSLSL